MKNTLVLRLNTNDYFFPKLTSQFNIMPIYTALNKVEWKLLKAKGKLYFLTSLKLGNWKKKIQEYDNIIIFDTGFNKYITKYIKKHSPMTKTILYFFNKIYFSYQEEWLNDPNIDEIWSFDHGDVMKYGLKYNSTFYYEVSSGKHAVKYDSVFIGRDKNRSDVINLIWNELNSRNCYIWFHIIKNENQYIPYEEYINKLIESKSILDVTQEGQEGLSLRFMEALFFKKKLITNNISIVNYDFYDSHNIFIIGKDNLNELVDFINTPYFEVDSEIISKYLYKNWLKRFD